MSMPKVQLIRRDGKVIELETTEISFDVMRGVQVWPIPVVGVRGALDLNENRLTIGIKGILTDDASTSGSSGATAVFDLSRPTGTHTSWFKQQQTAGYSTIANIVSQLHGREIVFRSAGQVSADVGENITVRFYSSSVPAATVATNSIIPVDLTGTINHTGDIATALNTALSGASVKVNAATVAMSTIFSITQSAGNNSVSGANQGVGDLTNEKITITNLVKSSDGNTPITKRADATLASSQNWSNTFFTSSAFTNGVSGVRMSRGDKVQDLLNMTVNVSAGGGLISPQSFAGNLIEMPDSLASFDVGKLLNIEQAESVKKYIVGLRIPYDSLLTANGGMEIVRQFVIPTGPGSDFSAEKNTGAFDPVETISGEIVRPNPYLRQGVAISGVVQQFQANYAAGDSVWDYNITFAAAEQLLGI